jgi:dephospho-CoA kinase
VPLVVGLTGGIGSGKSAAAKLFAAHGATVIDTDAIAHELTGPGGDAIAAIRETFGAQIIDPHGALDRAAMRRRVFAEPESKRLIEAILHPMIRAAAATRLAESRGPYSILVVPLLVESGAYKDRVDRVLVVDCSEGTQLARTMSRSNLREEDVRAIMAQQASRAERLAIADEVIDNNGNLQALSIQVDALHKRYLALARSEAGGG